MRRCRRSSVTWPSPDARRQAVSVWRTMLPFTVGPTTGDTRVGVLANPSGDCGAELRLVEAWARELGVEVVNLGTSAEPTSLPADCELVIALGGDGTILRALQLALTNRAAVLGINFGNVGFLADSGSDDLAVALERIARGEAKVDERIALAALVHAEPPRRMTAFNDVVIARVPGFGTARLRIDIDGQVMLALAGDGVVIASPTGSTAYTLGAGGPAVAPTLDAIVLTPLASQGSPLRSLVVDGGDTVRVTAEPSSAPLSIEVDGRTTVEVPAPASLEVRAAPHKARLVRTRPRTFYADLAGRL
jgi:NAD+ kinase